MFVDVPQKAANLITKESIVPNVKIKWKVEVAPTGQYRSFLRRGWPSALYPDGRTCGVIECVDDYTPNRAKDGAHGELILRVLDHSEVSPKWRFLKAKFTTLDQAKQGLSEFMSRHPEYRPGIYRDDQDGFTQIYRETQAG